MHKNLRAKLYITQKDWKAYKEIIYKERKITQNSKPYKSFKKCWLKQQFSANLQLPIPKY